MTAGRPPRILIVIQNISYTHDLRSQLIATTLQRAGYAVSVLSPRAGGDPRRRVDDGVSIRFFAMADFARLGLVGHMLEYLYSGIVISALCFWRHARRRVDVAHLCLPPHIFFPLIRALRATGVLVVADQHDLMPELFQLRYGPRRFLTRLVVASERAALRAADHVLVVNDSGARVAQERAGVPDGRVTMVRTGLREIPPIDLTAVDETTATVGYLGNMEPQDGLDRLIEAAGVVCHIAGRRDIRFVCIGDGSDLVRLRALKSTYDLNGTIEFTGRRPHEEALRRLSACDVCVQPDPRTPFNETCTMLKSLEYMALGKPIVAFDLDETRKACGDAALYAGDDSPSALARCIIELVDDPALRQRLGEAGRRRVRAHHHWARGEAALLSAYDRVVGLHAKTSSTEPSSPSGSGRPAA